MCTLYSFRQDGIAVFGAESGPLSLVEASGIQTQVSFYLSETCISVVECVCCSTARRNTEWLALMPKTTKIINRHNSLK